MSPRKAENISHYWKWNDPGKAPEEVRDRVPFDYLTPCSHMKNLDLCACLDNFSTRIMDLFTLHTGGGQRGLIVKLGKKGKTMLLKVCAIARKSRVSYLCWCWWTNARKGDGYGTQREKREVIASTFDEPAEKHVKVSTIAPSESKPGWMRARWQVILYGFHHQAGPRTQIPLPFIRKVLSGGVEATAMQKAWQFSLVRQGRSKTADRWPSRQTAPGWYGQMDLCVTFKSLNSNINCNSDRKLATGAFIRLSTLWLHSTRRDDYAVDKETFQCMWILREATWAEDPEEALNTLLQNTRGTRWQRWIPVSMNGDTGHLGNGRLGETTHRLCIMVIDAPFASPAQPAGQITVLEGRVVWGFNRAL